MRALRREVVLYRVQAGLQLAKCPFAEKTYAGLSRPVTRHSARRGTSSKVRDGRSSLPDTLGTSTIRSLASMGCYERQSSFCALLSRDACSWAPGCTSTGSSYQ